MRAHLRVPLLDAECAVDDRLLAFSSGDSEAIQRKIPAHTPSHIGGPTTLARSKLVQSWRSSVAH